MTTSHDAQARAEVEQNLSENHVVVAGAGSGKTTLLIERAYQALRTGHADADSLVLITYLEKAAEELRVRLGERVERGLREETGGVERRRIVRARARLSQCRISTLHGLGDRILRQFPLESGVTPDTVVWDGVETERQRALAFRAWLDQLDAGRRLRLLDFSEYGLTYSEWTRIITGEYPLAPPAEDEEAPAPESAAALVAAWHDVMEHLWDTIQKVHPDPGDRGVSQVAQLRDVARLLGALPPDVVGGRLFSAEIGAPQGSKAKWGSEGALLTRQKEALSAFKTRHQRWKEAVVAEMFRELSWLSADFSGFFSAWRRERRALIFSDQIGGVLALFAEYPEVRRTVSQSIRLLMVDEFQDTDPDQIRLVQWLAADGAAGAPDIDRPPPGRLVIVGDPQQSIYRFRGADYRNALAWTDRLVASGAARPVAITENFRCHPEIIHAVNQAFPEIFEDPDYDARFQALTSHRPNVPGTGPRVFALEGEGVGDDRDDHREGEAVTIARLVRCAVSEGWVWVDRNGQERRLTYGDIAILMPHRTGLEHYRQTFKRYRIPVAPGGTRAFYRRDDVRGLAAILRATAVPEDSVAVLAALRSPWFHVSDPALAAHRAARGAWHPLAEAPSGPVADALKTLRDWHQRWPELGADGIITAVMESSDHSQEPDRWRNQDRLRRQAVEYQRRWGFGEYCRWLWDRVTTGADEDEEDSGEHNGVHFSTVHQAKGLEWPMVIVANLVASAARLRPVIRHPEHGTMAFRVKGQGTSNWTQVVDEAARADAAERRRLWYVALTRARDYLVLVRDPAAPVWTHRVQTRVWTPPALLPDPLPPECADPVPSTPLMLTPDAPSFTPSAGASGGESGARMFGIRFHAEAMRVLTADPGRRPILLRATRPEWRQALQWLVERPWLDGRIWTEVPVSWSGPPAGHGVMDLVVQRSDGLWVVDLKTGKPDPDALTQYWRQLRWYADALRNLRGVTLAGMGLVYPTAQQEFMRGAEGEEMTEE